MSFIDECILQFDTALRTIYGKPLASNREYPANKYQETKLSQQQKTISGSLMRINHTGEVCAQALYLGQALMAKDHNIANELQQSAIEENDHLLWCQQRINELSSHTSYLNTIWFITSLAIGCIAGIAGDRWNLAFLAETEFQVAAHLKKHMQILQDKDIRSNAILQQMLTDELHHAHKAINCGAYEMPILIKNLMQFNAKIMTTITYYI